MLQTKKTNQALRRISSNYVNNNLAICNLRSTNKRINNLDNSSRYCVLVDTIRSCIQNSSRRHPRLKLLFRLNRSSLQEIPSFATIINLVVTTIRASLNDFIKQVSIAGSAMLESAIIRAFLNRMIRHNMECADSTKKALSLSCQVIASFINKKYR